MSDASGRVDVDLANLPNERAAIFRVADGDDRNRIAIVALPDIGTERILDIGEVVLVDESVILSGRIVDPRGWPIARAHVGTSGDHGTIEAGTDASGRFELRGTSDASSLCVHVGEEGSTAHYTFDVAAGRHDIDLRIPRLGVLAGRFSVDRDAAAFGIEFSLSRRPSISESVRPEARVARCRLGDDGSWEFDDLAPGTYTPSLQISGEPAPFLVIEDLEIREGRNEPEPSLAALDLHGVIRTLAITVLDPDGEMARDGRVTTGDFEVAYPRGTAWCKDGKPAMVATSRAAVDLQVRVAGCRDVHLAGIAGDTIVRLAPGLRLVVVPADGLSPAAPAGLDIAIRIAADPVSNRGPDVESFFGGRRGTDGETRFELEPAGGWVSLRRPGRYVISAVLGQDAWSVTLGTRHVVDVPEGPEPVRCVVSWTEADLEDALERAKR